MCRSSCTEKEWQSNTMQEVTRSVNLPGFAAVRVFFGIKAPHQPSRVRVVTGASLHAAASRTAIVLWIADRSGLGGNRFLPLRGEERSWSTTFSAVRGATMAVASSPFPLFRASRDGSETGWLVGVFCSLDDGSTDGWSESIAWMSIPSIQTIPRRG